MKMTYEFSVLHGFLMLADVFRLDIATQMIGDVTRCVKRPIFRVKTLKHNVI